MSNFKFSMDDLISQTPEPFIRESVKGLPNSKPLISSASALGPSDFDGYTDMSVLTTGDVLLQSPIFSDQASGAGQLDALMSTLTGATLPATAKHKDAGLGIFTPLVPTDIVNSARQVIAATPPPAAAANAGGSGSGVSSDAAAKAVAAAETQVGVAYSWGAESANVGFDCSGLTQWAYAQAGVVIPRVAQAQFDAGPAPGDAALLPGDLLYFGGSTSSIGHVGMYVGNSQMIDAPHSGATVHISSFTLKVGDAFGGESFVGTTRPAPSKVGTAPAGGGTGGSADPGSTIMGPTSASAGQMHNYYVGHRGGGNGRLQGVTFDDIIGYYISEGTAQNIRGDVAFVQACIETGNFGNNDTVINNYAGIAHPNNAPAGNPFGSPQIGVRAHIQLLYKVANSNTAPLAFPDVSPNWGGRFVTTWDGLNGNWAVPGTTYAQTIMSEYSFMLRA